LKEKTLPYILEKILIFSFFLTQVKSIIAERKITRPGFPSCEHGMKTELLEIIKEPGKGPSLLGIA